MEKQNNSLFGLLFVSALAICLAIIISGGSIKPVVMGEPQTNFSNTTVYTAYADSPSLDAFGRLRVSEPYTIFDSKQIHNTTSLYFDNRQVSGSGTDTIYNKNRASTTLTVLDNTAGHRVMQSYRRLNYQPGKSQSILVTYVFHNSEQTGITKRVGYFDNNNGIFHQISDGVLAVGIRSSVTGLPVDIIIEQSDWNLDKLDGTGISGLTLDPSKAQILAIDFEWLGVGRVRIGFVIDGKFYYVHEFLNSNKLDSVYMSTPNLPLRFEIINDGTGGASTLEVICGAVSSEGGIQPRGFTRSINTGTSPIKANIIGTTYAMLGVRLKPTNLDSTIIFQDFSVIVVTNDNFYWELLWNPTIAGEFVYADLDDSNTQVAIGNKNNPSNSVVTDKGIVLSSGAVSQQVRQTYTQINLDLLLGADILNNPDSFVLAITPISSQIDAYATLNWLEQK